MELAPGDVALSRQRDCREGPPLVASLRRTSAPAGGADKVFCIGLNKTGTTSLAAALEGLGYRLDDQSLAERLLPHWLRRDFDAIVAHAAGADAFQDIPFSLPFTYQALHMAYPQARFVLSLRDSPQEWYDSVLRFTRRIHGGSLPTARQLRDSGYGYPGFLHDAQFGTVPGLTEADPFDRAAHLRFYTAHRYAVTAYFRGSGRLLVLNPARPDSYAALCRFLGRSPVLERMPHLNRTV